MISYVVGILVAGLIVFGLYFGMQVGSPAYARQLLTQQAADKSLDELEVIVDSVGITTTVSQLTAAVTVIGQGDDQLDRRVKLLAKAVKTSDQSVQSICALSIQRMGDAAKPPIRKLLESSNANEVRSACGVIRPLGTNGDEFAPEILNLLASDSHFDRHAALYGIQEMSPEALLPGLKLVIGELDDPNFNTQIQACFVLQQIGKGAAPATERLIKLLQEGNPSSRSRAAEALAAIGPVDGYDIPELVGQQLESYAFLEKVRGLDAIGLMGDAGKTPENMARIQHLLDTPSLNCVAEASLAMYRLTGDKESALRKLKDMVKSRDSRLAALECIGAMGPDAADAVPNVMEHLADEETAVVETAVLALKKIGPSATAALPRLKKMVGHKDFLLSIAAQEAIDAISGKTKSK